MKPILFIIFFNIFFESKACDCIVTAYDLQYRNADFVALVKVTNIDKVDDNSEYCNIQIQIISLYKGDSVIELKVENPKTSGCGINTPLNSIWLIYAHKAEDGSLYFGSCSNPKLINNPNEPIRDSVYHKKYMQSIERELQILDFLRKTKINLRTTTKYSVSFKPPDRVALKGYKEEKDSFSAFELIFSEDDQLEEVHVLKSFANEQLMTILKNSLSNAKPSILPNTKRSATKKNIFVLYFYYPAEKGYEGFVSRYLL